MKNSWLAVIGLVLVAGILVVYSTSCLAHGKEEHPEEGKMSKHMDDMYALKEQIPEEYRIMERTPTIPDEESLARGQELYKQYCAVCHGEDGRGDGPAAQEMDPKPANFLDRKHSEIYGSGEKFWIIGNGSGVTGMPAFAQIGIKDRWNLVNYILELQKE